MDPQHKSFSRPSFSRQGSLLRFAAFSFVLLAWFAAASCIVAADDTRAQVSSNGRTAVGPGSYDARNQTYPASYGTFVPDLPVSHPPYNEFHASWVQRLDEPYIYLEHHGPYAETGSIIPVVIREMRIQGLEPAGPPFCLYYDDPASKPADQLLSRACVPIEGPRSPITPLRYDVLPSRAVTYAYVSGPYPEVSRCYPYMLEYMRSMNVELAGPIRETYIVPPSAAKTNADFLCKVQVPFRGANW